MNDPFDPPDIPTPGPNGSGAPASLALTTPGAWLRLDLDPRTRSESLARLVQDRLGDDPDLLVERRELTAALRSFARDATRAGAAYAAVLLDVIRDTPVQVSLVASYASVPGGDPADDPTLRVARSLSESDGAGVPPDIAPVSLRLGEGSRLVTVCEAPFGGDVSIPTLVAQYAVLVPDTDRVLVLSFSSPNINQSASMLSLFDAIAQGARWNAPATP